jgi:hypothetical protein
MKDSHGNAVQGRTRWRRVLILFAPATALAVTMMALVANGILAVSFAVNGQPFKLSADQLDGTGFVQIGSLNAVNACDPANAASCAAGHQFTAATLLSTATITNLTQTVCGPIPGFTNLTGLNGLITLKAGSSNPAAAQPTASNLVVDATQLNGGTASFDQGINIGENFSPAAGVDLFSQQAPHVVITSLTQNGTDTSAGTFTLPNLQLSASLTATCP